MTLMSARAFVAIALMYLFHAFPCYQQPEPQKVRIADEGGQGNGSASAAQLNLARDRPEPPLSRLTPRFDKETNPFPIIIVRADTMTLHMASEAVRLAVTRENDSYIERLRDIPVQILFILSPATDTAIDDAVLGHLRGVEAEVLALQNSATRSVTGSSTQPSVTAALLESLVLIHHVEAQHRVSSERLSNYASRTRALLAPLVAEEGCSYIQRLHSQVLQAKASMNEAAWRNFVVILDSDSTFRYDTWNALYFQWLLEGSGRDPVRLYTIKNGASVELGPELHEQGSSGETPDTSADTPRFCISRLPVGDRGWL